MNQGALGLLLMAAPGHSHALQSPVELTEGGVEAPSQPGSLLDFELATPPLRVGYQVRHLGWCSEVSVSPRQVLLELSWEKIFLATNPGHVRCFSTLLPTMQGDWLDVSPAMLATWDISPLEPMGEPKHLHAYALCQTGCKEATHAFCKVHTVAVCVWM